MKNCGATMNISIFSVQTLPSFHNLAIFICHLFIDGHFRQGNILYDPKVFNDRLLVEIDSVCPSRIPWQSNDVTQLYLSDCHVSERTDHILQLIFFDSNDLMENIEQYQECFTYYRIFVFSSFDDTKLNQQKSITKQLNRISSANMLIAQHNLKDDAVFIHSMSENENINDNSLQNIIYRCDECENKFWPSYGQTFGKYERDLSISMKVVGMFRERGNSINCSDYKSIVPITGNMYLANLFNSKLNGSYINMTCISYDGNSATLNSFVRHIESKYYKEIWNDFEQIKDDNM